MNSHQDPEFLQFFWDLSSLDEFQRVQATHHLLQYLTSHQDELKNEESKLFDYTMKRLVKGINSSRDGARQGFSLALSSFLRTFNSITVKEILDQIQKETEITKKTSRQEAKDLLLGRTFGIIAIVRSGRLSNDTTEVSTIIQEMVQLSQKKDYLEEICYQAIVSVIEQIPFHVFEKDIFPHLQPHLSKNPNDFSVDQFAVLLKIRQLYPEQSKKYFPKWKQDLTEKNLEQMKKILKESSKSHPRLHSVWEPLLQEILQPTSTNHQFLSLKIFWNAIIEETFFSSTHERKYIGFRLFDIILPKIPEDYYSYIFTKNFLRCLINHLSEKENYLHQIAKQIISQIIQVAKEKRERRIPIVMQLTGENGHKQFDQLTETTTIRFLLSDLDEKSSKEYLDFLKNTFLNQNSDQEHTVTANRIWALQQMSNISKHKINLKKKEILKEILDFFMFHGFFTPSPTTKLNQNLQKLLPNSIVSQSIAQFAKERFFGLLNKLNDRKTEENVKLIGMWESDYSWNYQAYLFQKQLLNSKLQEITPISNINQETRKNSFECIEKIQNQLETVQDLTLQKQLRSFQGLIICLELSLSLNDLIPFNEYLEELLDCYEAIFEQGKEKKPEHMEPILGLLISMLNIDSALFRNLVQQAFRSFCVDLTLPSLKVMLKVFASGEIEEEESEREDKETKSLENTDEEEDSSDEEEHEETNDVTEDKEEDPKEEEDSESVDDEMIDMDELPEEEILKYDEHLADVLKTLTKPRKEKSNQERQFAHLELKTLELLDIFIQQQKSNPLVLYIITPLLRIPPLKNATLKRQVETKRNSVLSHLFKLKSPPKKFNQEVANSLNQSLFKLWKILMKIKDRKTKIIALEGVHFLIRCLVGNKDLNNEKFGALNQQFITRIQKMIKSVNKTRSSHFNSKFVNEFIKRQPQLGWHVVDDIVSGTLSARNEFLKSESFSLLYTLVSQRNFLEKKLLFPVLSRIQSLLKEFLDTKPHAKRLQEVLAAIHGILKVSHITLKEAEWKEIDFESLKQTIKEIQGNKQYEKTNSIQDRSKQILRMTGGSYEVIKKRKQQTETSPKGQKKKKKKTKLLS